MASHNTDDGWTPCVHQETHATPPDQYIIGRPDCTICHWDQQASPAFTDEMREMMEDIFQKGEIIRQRSAHNRGVTTFVRKHSSLPPKQDDQSEPNNAS